MPRDVPPLNVNLPNSESTTLLAETLAQHLQMGDTLLLSGPVGAGKSHIARALIRAFFGAAQEVPSPSFTLVQTYSDEAIEIWHADLYRLTHSGEVVELGLEDAMGRALCLIEWPDRLGELTPKTAVHLSLAYAGDGRSAAVDGANATLRAALTTAFTT